MASSPSEDPASSEPAVDPACYPGLPACDGPLAEAPLLEEFCPSERFAILVYRRQVMGKDCRVYSLEESIEMWVGGDCKVWRRAKIRQDGKLQLAEIEVHKYHVSQKTGYDIGFEAASRDWVEKYAAKWREWWETRLRANPLLGRRLV